MKFQASLKFAATLVLSTVLVTSCLSVPEIDDGNCYLAGADTLLCKIDEIPAAIVNQSGSTPQTKTSLSQSHVPVWSAGDEISVFGDNGSASCFTLTDGTGTANGSFFGRLAESNNYYAVYPYDAGYTRSGGKLKFSRSQNQPGVVDDFPKDGNMMVAQFTADNLHPAFKNVFGLLELKLSGTAKVGKITLTSKNNSDKLWGNFSLALSGSQGSDSQSLTVSGGSNVVNLVFANPVQLQESGARSFYFVLPAGTLASGFCADVFDNSGNLVCTQTSSRNQSISRSRIRSMVAVNDVNRIAGVDLDPEPTTWAAYNNHARTGTEYQTVIDPQTSGYPQTREKYVGAFYFIWHTTNSAGGGPYDVQKSMGSGNYNFLDVVDYSCGGGKTHHWGEPYLGYYRDDDLWVLRKHAQMLVDAGVDFLAFDTTNNVFYESEIIKLCELYLQMRAEGNKTPQLTFMVWHSAGQPNSNGPSEYDNFDHNPAVTYLYNTFYTNERYKDLWFKWEGKPLLMALGSHVTNPTIKNYFTFRPTWYLWNTQAQTRSDVGDPWYYGHGGPNDKWPWAVCYTNDTTDPMIAGKHNGVNEFCPVSPATHPVSNIGRSYPINQGITYTSGADSYPKQPEKGIYFRSQFNAANDLDPEIMFFTGWNEWLMGHFAPGVLEFYWCGGVHAKYSMFVDQYNNEFSRDLEPIKGDYGDNYYYYMADFIRRFKGVDPTPTYSKTYSITIDGKFADWNNVSSCYADDKEDTKWRGYNVNNGNSGWAGYGSIGQYFNKTGRNDLRLSKVATDGTNVCFYIEAASELTGYSQANTGLNLLITSGNSPKWEGFNYLVEPAGANSATLKSATGSGYNWSTVCNVNIAVSGKSMEVSIPLSRLGISNTDSFTLDFKWVDNVDLSQPEGMQQCMRDGDSAPNGRFRYRYVFNR